MWTYLANFIAHPKTTIAGFLGGTTAGAAVLGLVEQAAHQAHCDFSLINWSGLGVVAVGSIVGMLTGGVMKSTTPVVPPPASPPTP